MSGLFFCLGNAVGIIQCYRWSDYPSHATQLGADESAAGIDLAIGESHYVGRGLGAAIIREFLQQIVFVRLDVTSVVTDPEEKNTRSIKALERAGFRVLRTVRLQGETESRCVVRIERPDL